MGFTDERATRITAMIGRDNDVWALLQVNPNNLEDLSRFNKAGLQDAIARLQRARDTGKTPEAVVREKRESSRILFERLGGQV
jgi:plasmid maintenance system antidote protein VapI